LIPPWVNFLLPAGKKFFKADFDTPHYIGYGSNNYQEELEARNVVRIRSHHWRRLAEKAVKVTPAIERLHPNDTAETIISKLTEENKAHADTEYSISSNHYEA